MWRVNEHGLLFAQGKPLSRDLRLLIFNKIINVVVIKQQAFSLENTLILHGH